MENLKEFIRLRIAFLRTAKNVSARDLSLSLGYDESYINKIENGISLPSLEALGYICDYFKISLSEFFDEGNTNPVVTKRLLSEIKGLPPSSLETLITLAKELKKK